MENRYASDSAVIPIRNNREAIHFEFIHIKQRKERERQPEKEKEPEKYCAIGAASSSFQYIKIYFYTAPAHLSYIAGSFYRTLIIARPTFVELFTFPVTPI